MPRKCIRPSQVKIRSTAGARTCGMNRQTTLMELVTFSYSSIQKRKEKQGSKAEDMRVRSLSLHPITHTHTRAQIREKEKLNVHLKQYCKGQSITIINTPSHNKIKAKQPILNRVIKIAAICTKYSH